MSLPDILLIVVIALAGMMIFAFMSLALATGVGGHRSRRTRRERFRDGLLTTIPGMPFIFTMVAAFVSDLDDHPYYLFILLGCAVFALFVQSFPPIRRARVRVRAEYPWQ